ncbi:MAG: hypothetical protein AAFZ65_11550, partial [Planctomycetota bacterium]
YATATAAGYSLLRSTLAPFSDTNASIELVPYRGLAPADAFSCPDISENPAGDNPAHDAGTPFEVWTFESTPLCGPPLCDGTRVGLLWTAPLSSDCTTLQDRIKRDFVSQIDSVRRGPDDYSVLDEQTCQGGGGPGNGGPPVGAD